MPASKVNLRSVSLGEAANRFLETKTPSTREAYDKCLKRFRYFYEDELERFIGEIEADMDLNETRSLSERVRPGEETIRRFILWHKEKGYAPKSTRQGIAALQNALKYYGIQVSFDFIELPPDRALAKNDKHQWTLDEMREFVGAAEYIRDKAFIMVAFQTGLSISDILDLDYRDIKREYEEGILPLMIHTYRQKTGVEIKTFLGRDAVHYLDSYLKTRGTLSNDSPLFTMLGNETRASKAALQKMLREYAKKMDFILEEDMNNGFNPARPHSLRSAFRSRLTGKMENTLIEFFMGHAIGDQVKTYINMPPDELREIYANYEHLLSIEKTSLDEQSTQTIPSVAMDQIKKQGQRIAELETELAETVEKVKDIQQMRLELDDIKAYVLQKSREEMKDASGS